MRISFDVEVSQENKYAALYGVKPGIAHYESEELSKSKFLNFSNEYFRSVFVVDEINLWLADARRTMSTQNLLADDVTQQLRKWESPLFYTCIHEMFVDSRIRDMTDLFIKSKDTALTEEGLRNKQHQGLSFEWRLYPMTTKFTGYTYSETKQALGPITVHGKKLWNIIDTALHQERKKYKPEEEDPEAMPVNIEEDPRILQERSKWGWLYESMLSLHQQGVSELDDDVLWEFLRLKERGLSTRFVGQQLKAMNIKTRPGRRGHIIYEVDGFDLKYVPAKEYVIA